MEDGRRPAYQNIRYTKIHFTIEYTEDTEVVKEKASALRGGVGEMLLRAHCISDRDCGSCGFEDECMVQRIMYSKFPYLPQSMHQGDSVGYILYCAEQKKSFRAGETMEFTLTLFGKTIVYFSQYLNALYALGMSGLGSNESHFRIVSVKNLFGEQILQGADILMEKYKWQTVGDYIRFRKKKLGSGSGAFSVQFLSPLAVKYQGELISEFRREAIAAALLRRINILGIFEELLPGDAGLEAAADFPVIVRQRSLEAAVQRYSSRKQQLMKLNGIRGMIDLENVPEEWLELLMAGEITHIGKNTSFGFGKYVLERRELDEMGD